MMPVMDGFEMVKRLKSDEKFKHIPVILLTAKTDEDLKIEGPRMGADAYLTKPFSARELRASVESSLAQSRKKNDSTTNSSQRQDHSQSY